MALNFPISASNNQKFTFANKTWRYISASNAWRIEPISGSYLDNITDVDVDSAPHNSFLTYQNSKWIGKLYTGSYSGDYFTTSSVDKTDPLQSKLVFTNQGYANSNLNLPNNVNVNFVTESLVLGGITNQFLDSEGTEVYVLSASTAITASSGESAASIEHYPDDNYISGSELTNDILYVSMSSPVIVSGSGADIETTPQYHSSSLSKYTRLKTVLGKSPDVNGDVNIALNTVLTGSLAVRPTSSIDGTLWVIQNETGSRIGQNGRAFLYSEGPDDWFEVTPPTQDAADDRYALISGSTMLNNLRAADLPIASEEPAVKSLADIQVPTSDTNLNAFYIEPSTTSTIPYNTWTDWTALDTVESNTISGSTITNGVFTVPSTGISRMTFTAGAHIRESQNSRGTNLYIRIVKNNTDIIAVKSHMYEPVNGNRSFINEGINVSTGLIRVNPGDTFKVQLKRGWRNRNKTFAPGISGADLPNGSNNIARKSGGSFFCGVTNDTPPGTGVTNIVGGSGINSTGTDEVKTLSVNSTVIRTDIDYTIYTDQRITGSLEGTGSLIISGNSISNNVIFSGSAFLTGDTEITGLGNYTSDVEAAANGVEVGKLYRNGNQVMIRIS